MTTHAAPPIPQYLMVYGTLRSGYPNAGYLRAARFVGRATTVAPFTLRVGAVPHLVEHPARTPVVGEVYAVDLETLARCDRLEGHPHWYRRQEIPVRGDDGEIRLAWVYFSLSPDGDVSATGDYADHVPPPAALRPHGRETLRG